MTRPFPSLFPRLVPVSATQQKQLRAMERKSVGLLPSGMGAVREFFSPDGGQTIIDLNGAGATAVAFVAYWYVAMRWRAQKIAEAPLMVIAEDQDSGDEEWLPDHDLVPVLDTPSDDYDMGELLERTSRYLDNYGECIWVIDFDNVDVPARLTPFHRDEYQVKASSTRLYDRFIVKTRGGKEETFTAEQVCYFRDGVEGGWLNGNRSRLDVAMSWLRLGERARQTVRDLLENSIWPSGVIIPDKEWNPDPETLEQYKQDIEQYGMVGMKGRPFVQLGGGTFASLQTAIKDLVPTDILNRVESVVAAVSGVPAVVLQFQVGMENSPWSQMAQARKMAYDDTIDPAWRKIERVTTRQLLRPNDEDKTHFIRFDRSRIASLQEDQLTAVQTANLMGRAASVNERRGRMGLEPATPEQDPDGKADEIPELSQPSLAEALAGAAGSDPNAKEPPPDAPAKDKKKPDEKKSLSKKIRSGALQTALRDEARTHWKAHVTQLIATDQLEIVDIVKMFLVDASHKSIESKARGKDRVMSAVIGYLRSESQPRWSKATTPLLVQAAERSSAVVAADLGVSFKLLHPHLLSFARKNAGELIQGVSRTTRDAVNDVITNGLAEGLTTAQIADAVSKCGAFSDSRAELIARTETTRAFNGAPNDALKAFSRSTGRKFVKTWSGSLDDRERDEHVALEGETVGIDEQFSNGLDYPSEPNCRCTAIHSEVDA